jgi:general secretion pathway protein D
LKTITRILWGLVTLAASLSATKAPALSICLLCDTDLAVLAVSQTPGTAPAASADKRRQSDDFLARARQAASEGQFDVAEQLIQRAEALKVPYSPLNPLVDTPARARRDVQRRRAGASSSSSLGRLLSPRPLSEQPRAKAAPPDPFKNAAVPAGATPSPAAAGAQVGRLGYAHPAGIAQPSPLATMPGPAPQPMGGDDMAGFATAQSLPTPPSAAIGSSAAVRDASSSNPLLLEARRALAMGDVRRATDLVNRARSYPTTYRPQDDTPDRVLTDVTNYSTLVAHSAEQKQTEGYRRQFARLMMQQADALARWKDYDEAERLAMSAKDQRVTYSPMEASPDTLLERIAAARSQSRAVARGTGAPGGEAIVTLPAPSLAAKKKVADLLGRARVSLASGNLPAAQTLAQTAMDLQVPESSFAPGEDRPGLVLLDIQKARQAGGSGVVAASGVLPATAAGVNGMDNRASQAIYDAAHDPTRNVPANAFGPGASEMPRPLLVSQATPSPAPPLPTEAPPAGVTAGNPGVSLFNQGEAALKAGKIDEALQRYREAAQYQSQLDPTSAQKLQDRLQMLSVPAAPQAPRGTLANEAMAKQELLARQVNSDVAYQERRATEIRESNPKEALALLEQARMRVEAAGLEATARDTLLRRVDRSIAEMKQFMDDNRSRLDLADRNNQTREQVDREQKHRIEIRQRLAQLGEQFNQLREEQRFAEAVAVAKEAYDLAPDDQFARQLFLDAKFAQRIAQYRNQQEEKENAVVAAFDSVDVASKPYDDRNPMIFPSPKDWDALSTSRKRFKPDVGRERSGKELEIQQKLKTPVSAQFTGAPLSQVLDQLQQLADVNIYLDPQGLTEEGVESSTPVSINLRHEISLASALNLILEPLHLSYVIKDDVLKITSEQNTKSEMVTRTYDVGDLVVPIPNFVPNSRMGLGGAYNDAMSRAGFNTTNGAGPAGWLTSANEQQSGTVINPAVLGQMARPMAGPATGSMASGAPIGPGPGGLGGGDQADFGPLIELITQTVEPDSWDEMGGGGTIHEYENNLTLVIKQTEKVHAEIVEVLEQLRRLQDLQVTIEVRFITLNDDFFESIRVDFDFDLDDNIDGRRGVTFGQIIDNAGGGTTTGTTTTGGTTEPPRDVTDRDHGRSVTVGLASPGVFSADLDIPFTQGSYALAVPQFGGFDATAGASLGFAVLSDIEAFFFINAAQGDTRTNILQAPKVTLFNGQQAFVQDGSYSPFVMGLIPVVGDFAAAQQPVIVILSEGTFLTVQAVVSHDRRFVRLTVVPFFSQIGDVNTFTFYGRTTSTTDTSTEGNQETPDDASKKNNVKRTTSEGSTVQLPTYSTISVSTTVSVPDGGTVLLGGIKRLNEGRNEYGTPILNKIPYISRLFKNVGIGRETQSLMMTVTPRIIIQEEEEERIAAGPTSR